MQTPDTTEPLTPKEAEKLQQHGRDWDGRSINGWHVSEKLEGCRAYWDGRNLYTKSGNVIDATGLIAQLPQGIHLDGEIWAGRGNFELARLFTQHGKHADKVQFIVFDAPGMPGDWPQRIAAARRLGVACVTCAQVTDPEDMARQLAKVLALGGEGLMLRRPGQPYTPGRSNDLLKVKAHSLELLQEPHEEAA